MEKYTAKQYAEMYGGHTVTEEAIARFRVSKPVAKHVCLSAKDSIKREGARNRRSFVCDLNELVYNEP